MQVNFFKTVNWFKHKLLARHRKGFSVHSPFVFELLNNVFFEKEHYYCYEEIEKIIKKNAHNTLFFNKLKYYKLIFRLANYFNTQKILIVGKNNFIKKIFNFVSSKTKVFYAENIEEIEKNDFDLIFFTENCFKTACHYGLNSPTLKGLGEVQSYEQQAISVFPSVFQVTEMTGEILIFENIYQKKEINVIWKNICNDNNLKISIDIFHFGIIINKKDIPKQHYRVAF